MEKTKLYGCHSCAVVQVTVTLSRGYQVLLLQLTLLIQMLHKHDPHLRQVNHCASWSTGWAYLTRNCNFTLMTVEVYKRQTVTFVQVRVEICASRVHPHQTLRF